MPNLTKNKRIHLDYIKESTEKLKELSSLLKECGDEKDPANESFGLLKQEIVDLRRKIREFDSDLFIVATLGLLKAGKSSLINLLSRSSLASPTGYGHDTTLRPALIMQAPEETPDRGRIIVWFAKDKSQFTDALDDVIDKIRGISDDVTMATSVVHELTQENLNILLCQTCAQAGNMLYDEPVLVVVQVPRFSDSILSDNVVLLDTPGLDSNTSTWTRDNHWYEWIICRCDLLLFLQSSVAPLNEKANAVLKNILDKNRRASIWLLQNQMEGKFWCASEVIHSENEKQAKHAAELFKLAAPDFTARMLRANLGKASTAILETASALAQVFPDGTAVTRDVLLTQSGFNDLQLYLGRSLEENAEEARLKNCIGDLCNATRNLQEQWQAHENLLGRGGEGAEEKIKQIEGETELYLRQLTTPFSPLCQDGDCDVILSGDQFGEDMINSFDDKFKEKDILGGSLNDFAEEMKKSAQQECRDKADRLRPEIVMILRGGSPQSLKSCILDSVKVFLEETCSQFMSGRNIVMPLNTISRGDLAHSLSSSYHPDVFGSNFFRPILSKGKVWKFLWEKKYTRLEAEDKLISSGNVNSLKSKIKEYFEAEQSRLSRYITKWAEDQRKALIDGYKGRVIELAEQMKGDIRKQQEAMKADQRICKEAAQVCNAIVSSASNLN